MTVERVNQHTSLPTVRIAAAAAIEVAYRKIKAEKLLLSSTNCQWLPGESAPRKLRLRHDVIFLGRDK